MTDQQVRKVVAIVLIVIAAVLALGVLGMWMMPSMMGGMMGGGMMGSMSGCALCMFGPLLLAAILIALAIVLLRSKP
jgi:hypothetical protein